MDSVVSIERVKRFPAVVWMMLIGIFFVRGTYYMVSPFLAVILFQRYGMSATDIGLLISFSVTLSVVVGIYTGNLSDRLGRVPMLYLAATVGVAGFTMLALSQSFWLFVLAVLVATFPRTLWDAPSKALLGDVLDDPKDRELALQGLYFMTNVGAAIGPLFGLWAGLNGEQFSFAYTAFAYLGLIVAMLFLLPRHGHKHSQREAAPSSFRQTLKLLAKDHVFMLLIVANILIMFVFAQGDSSLMQYLARADIAELTTLISSIVIVNSVTIIALQFPLLKLMEGLSVTHRIYVGVGLLLVSQFGYAFNPADNISGWLWATFVLSVAEAILFANMNVQLDQLAPAHLRGSYFGAASLYSLGYALAPVIGGILLDTVGGQWLYLSCAMVCATTLLMYLGLKHLSRPDFAQPDWQPQVQSN